MLRPRTLTPQERLREGMRGIMAPPAPGESYEMGGKDFDPYRVPRTTEGPLLNSSGKPTGIDKLILGRETLRNLQFPNPDEMVGPPEPEGDRDRVLRLQREMVVSGHQRCGNVVERGIEHTKMLICNIYLGLGGGWDPPKP